MLYVVALVYYPQHFARVRQELTLLESAMSAAGLAVELQVVVNNPELTTDGLPYRNLRHDNDGMEFGGYQRGLDTLVDRLQPHDVVLFLNDTFCTHHYFSQVVRSNLVLAVLQAQQTSEPMIAGYAGRSSYSFLVGGLRVERWVSTQLFCLNATALAVLQNQVYVPTRNRDVVGGSTLATFFHRSVDVYLRAHIASWLFYREGHNRWYQSAALSADNAHSMMLKAQSIVQELYLSARLERARPVFRVVNPRGLRQRASHLLESLWAERVLGAPRLSRRELPRSAAPAAALRGRRVRKPAEARAPVA